MCANECAERHPNQDKKLVFTEPELLCTQNCIQKNKASMNLAMQMLQILNEPENQ